MGQSPLIRKSGGATISLYSPGVEEIIGTRHNGISIFLLFNLVFFFRFCFKPEVIGRLRAQYAITTPSCSWVTSSRKLYSKIIKFKFVRNGSSKKVMEI